jgi:hypothetical protein
MAEVQAWARQTLMFAINLAHRGLPEPANQAEQSAWFDKITKESADVADRLWAEAQAELPPDSPAGSAMLDYIGKVLSWAAERRHGIK